MKRPRALAKVTGVLPIGLATVACGLILCAVANAFDIDSVELRCSSQSIGGGWILFGLVLLLPLSLLGAISSATRVRAFLGRERMDHGVSESLHTALETTNEGLLVLDAKQRIILANEAFAETLGRSCESLQGERISDLPWVGDAKQEGDVFPWEPCLADGTVTNNQTLKLQSDRSGKRILRVNVSPLTDKLGGASGALAAFTDVTTLEIRDAQLTAALTKLKHARDQIRKQNEELHRALTSDPLTGCLNRRAFYQEIEHAVGNAERADEPLSYIIADIDFFKAINDNHGHAVGDEVLKKIAWILKSRLRDKGLVCRYGGEEFSFLLPGMDVQQAGDIAETLRQRIESARVADLNITMCFGVSQFGRFAASTQEAMELADRALYVAKRTGRNRVVRADQMGAVGFPIPEADWNTREEDDHHIPFAVVSALSASLHYRDHETASHCRRVADLCGAVSRGLLPESQRYILEVAALLHDIGKLGVSDSILFKPGPLTRDELLVMRSFETIGVKILENALASTRLVEIVRTYRAQYGGNPETPHLPSGDAIPLAARILMIADAYDSMTSNHVYRKGRTREEAFAELRSYAGSQFDPTLVERFIEIVSTADSVARSSASGLSRDAALEIGLQIERMTNALDARNAMTLRIMVDRLNSTAEANGVEKIAGAAQQLASALDEAALEDDPQWLEVVDITGGLLELCRDVQRASLEVEQAEH